MAQLVITEANARKFYPTADPAFKQSLIDTFGEEFFKEKDFRSFKTFEDCCIDQNEDPNDLKFHDGPLDEVSYRRLKVIARSLNRNKTLSFADKNQYKWFPWFEHDGTGFRFLDSDYYCANAFLAGGSRLCYISEEVSNYAGKQFISEYNNLLK